MIYIKINLKDGNMGRKTQSVQQKSDFIHLKPKEVDADVWITVVSAWRNGLNDREAAFRACEDTGKAVRAEDIKLWKKGSYEVAELCERLKDDLKSVAKTNVANTLRSGDKDGKMSRWYLEHRCPEEFSTKSAVAFEGQVVNLSLAEKEEALRELVENFENGGQ